MKDSKGRPGPYTGISPGPKAELVLQRIASYHGDESVKHQTDSEQHFAQC